MNNAQIKAIKAMVAEDFDLMLIHDHETGEHVIAILDDSDPENVVPLGAVSFNKEQLQEFALAVIAAASE